MLAGTTLATLALQLVGANATTFDLHGWPIATLMLAAFFIVTDPVTGCLSPRGRIFFGAGAGLLAVLLTHFGPAADGLPFAILSMNIAAPWIDRRTRPIRRQQGMQP